MMRIGKSHLVRDVNRFPGEFEANYLLEEIGRLMSHVAMTQQRGSIDLNAKKVYHWHNVRRWLDLAHQFGFRVTWVYNDSFQLDLSLWGLVSNTWRTQYLSVAAKTAYAAKYWRWLRRRGILTANPDIDNAMQRTLRPNITDDLRLWEQYNLLSQVCLPGAVLTYIGDRDEHGNEVPPLKFKQEVSVADKYLGFTLALLEKQEETGMMDLFAQHATQEERDMFGAVAKGYMLDNFHTATQSFDQNLNALVGVLNSVFHNMDDDACSSIDDELD